MYYTDKVDDDDDDVSGCVCMYARVCLPQIWMIWNTNQMLTFWFEFSNFPKATDFFFVRSFWCGKWQRIAIEEKTMAAAEVETGNMVDKQFYPTLNGVTLEILTIWFNSLAQHGIDEVFSIEVKQSFKYTFV